MLADNIYQYTLIASKYYDDPKHGYQRYDNHIKPLIYAKYWKDELEYYPKLSGIEKIEYLQKSEWWAKHLVYIPLDQILENIKSNKTVEYTEN